MPRPTDVERVTEAAVQAKIFDLLARRRDGATVCPSEVARALVPAGAPWRGLMPRVRDVAQRLADARRLRVTRAGVPVDATSRGGPVRLGRPSGKGETPAPARPIGRPAG